MSAREAILARLRQAPSARRPHPGPHSAPTVAAGDLHARFAEAWTAVGGEGGTRLAAAAFSHGLGAELSALAEGGAAAVDDSTARALGDGASPIERLSDGRTLASLRADPPRVVALRGAVAAADCGAVLVRPTSAVERAAAFLCETLVLWCDVDSLCPDLHRAAARAASAPASFVDTWIAGPSKTADIELALVYGAHGPRRAVLIWRGEGTLGAAENSGD